MLLSSTNPDFKLYTSILSKRSLNLIYNISSCLIKLTSIYFNIKLTNLKKKKRKRIIEFFFLFDIYFFYCLGTILISWGVTLIPIFSIPFINRLLI